MTIKQARAFDAYKSMLFAIVGAIAFGFWMRSISSAIFMFVVLDAALYVGWAIEYQGVDYDPILEPPTEDEGQVK